MRPRVLVGLVLALAVAARARAQPIPDKARARGLLGAIEIDLRAIRDGSQPIEEVQRQAVEVREAVAQLPLALGGSPPAHVGPILLSLKENAGRLLAQAESQDRFACASVADDLLRDVERLRTAVGFTP